MIDYPKLPSPVVTGGPPMASGGLPWVVDRPIVLNLPPFRHFEIESTENVEVRFFDLFDLETNFHICSKFLKTILETHAFKNSRKNLFGNSEFSCL